MNEKYLMNVQAKQIFVNLPIKDIQRTRDFFSQLGYSFNEEFSNEKALCLLLGENLFAMLLTEEFFKSFIKKDLVDAHKATEALLGLSLSSREDVDQLVDKAVSLGAKTSRDPDDHGWMYSRSFEDLDGHIWEYFWMDPSKATS